MPVHVIIATEGRCRLPFTEAAGIAVWYSGAGEQRPAEVDIVVARCQKAIRALPGRVIYSQYNDLRDSA